MEVRPAAGRKYIVVYEGLANTGVERHELGRTIDEIIRLRAELSEREFADKAREAGFHPLSPDGSGSLVPPPPSPDARQTHPGDAAPAPETRPAAPAVVSWEEAHRYVGRDVTVEGKIVRTHRGKKVLYLNFHSNWKKYVTVVILGKDLRRFPKNPEKHYMGRKVRVRGVVALYRDRPEIVVRSPGAIAVLE